MKKLFVIFAVLFSLNVSAQTTVSPVVNNDSIRFLVSNIVTTKAPDSDDTNFIAVAIREELIRAKKIAMSSVGDTLFVTLLVQHQKGKNGENSSYGRDGKHGEISVSVVSKNGKAAATSRGYLSSANGEQYYLALQIISEKAAERFEFVK